MAVVDLLLGTFGKTMAVVGHYWKRSERKWQTLITTGNVVIDNGNSWSLMKMFGHTMTFFCSLLGFFLKKMAAVDHYR